jgi:copper chaperone CopZ
MKREIIKTIGMHCNGCEISAQELVGELPGIKKVKADYKTEEVFVEFDENRTNVADIRKKIVEAGFIPE